MNDNAADPDVVEVPVFEEAPHQAPPISTFSRKAKQRSTSSRDEEVGQALYAGGWEHSGQQDLAPPKKKRLVTEMFKSVQKLAAEVVEPGQISVAGSSAFTETDYKMGQTSTEVVGSASNREPSRMEITLKLWREGFSLDDGDIRAYKDPENRQFLNSLRKGKLPSELSREALGVEVHLNMEDRRSEEFPQFKQKTKAFSGAGNWLCPSCSGAGGRTGAAGGGQGR